MTAWDAARAASKRPLRKPYKPVAAVGAKLPVFPYPGGGSETPPTRLSKEGICVCGYHVCSCARDSGREIALHAPKLLPTYCPACKQTPPQHDVDCYILHAQLQRDLESRTKKRTDRGVEGTHEL